MIKEATASVTGKDMEIVFEVNPDLKIQLPEERPRRSTARRGTQSQKKQKLGTDLNEKYIFKNFVIGPSNNFAHASSLAVAQSPGKAYNPLFIYGSNGLGKTHLMQAIGHYTLDKSPMSVCYVSCETLMNEYITALQQRAIVKFRKRYRSADVLLVDDIHFLANKNSLQEEFFHTFNILFDARKQIVMTSDRPAAEISGLEQRLVSRFEWGLVSELGVPDFETRMAILRSHQTSLNIQLDEEVIVFIASNIKANIRRLEGSLNRAASYASLLGRPVTTEDMRKLIGDFLQQEHEDTITITSIQEKVAKHFDLRVSDITGKHRSKGIAVPRQIAMFLCRRFTNSSFPEIGNAFGKTHATVLHACRNVESQFAKNNGMRHSVAKLANELGKNSSDLFEN